MSAQRVTCIHRRTVVAGLGAMIAAPPIAAGQGDPAGAARPRAIDVHHHVLPPFYKEHAAPWLRRFASNVEEALGWTPEGSLAAMDRGGVETSVLSISAPGTSIEGVPDADLARRLNDYMAALVRAYPGRFRFFSVLPLPSGAPALAEARRGFDKLGAEGVGLLSNYGGRYLGDPAFTPLFEELNRRAAIVYVHPTNAPCCAGLVPDVLDPLIEFPVDTGRTISSLLWSGTLSRFPDIKWLFSHGAGILPMVAERVAGMGFIRPELNRRVPGGVQAALARLYVDTASVTNPPAMAALRAWLPARQILFGTDYPWGTADRALAALDRLALPSQLLAGIRRDHALALLG